MKRRLVLADKYMPECDAREYHEKVVHAPAADAYAALRSVDLSRSPVIRAIFAIRTIPSWLRGEPSGAPRGPFVEQALGLGWVVLEEHPGEELLAGAVTRPWEPIVRFRGLPPDEFVGFCEPDYAKIVWGLAARPRAGGVTALCTETRVQTTDAGAQSKFARYWFALGVGIRLIRSEALRIVANDLRAQ